MGIDVIKTIQTLTPVDIGLIKSIDNTCHDDNLSAIRTIKIKQSHKDKDDLMRMDRVTRNKRIYRDKR